MRLVPLTSPTLFQIETAESEDERSTWTFIRTLLQSGDSRSALLQQLGYQLPAEPSSQAAREAKMQNPGTVQARPVNVTRYRFFEGPPLSPVNVEVAADNFFDSLSAADNEIATDGEAKQLASAMDALQLAAQAPE